MSENRKAEKIVGVKGMNDILPADAPLWELFENTVQSVLKSYGFQQIRTPIVEPTALFARGLGAAGVIVRRRDGGGPQAQKQTARRREPQNQQFPAPHPEPP